MINSTNWQYYGTANVGGNLEMIWNTSLVRAERVNIELWGYREIGKYKCNIYALKNSHNFIKV